jgi:PEP-CTERM motif
MRKSVTLLFVVCLLVGICAAQTNLIIGQSSGDVVLSNPAGTVDFSFAGDVCGSDCLSGFGYYGTTVGNYEMTLTGTPTLGTPTGGVYPVNMNGASLTFDWSAGSSFLDGNITLDNITDGTQDPRVIGSMYITSSSLTGYAAGSNVSLDFNIYLGTNPSLDYVAQNQGSSTEGYISAGEINQGSTPEPGSFVLFGSGAIGLALVVKRRIRL